jgi:sugar lactone lactonase YvrE
LHTDSTRRTIYAFDFDVLTSSLSNKRIWKIFTPHEGYPDGMTFDSTGHLWVAHWGTGLVSQFNQVGELLQRGQLPVSNVTNMAFGGVDLNRLFVTSASVGNSIDSLINEPLAGCIFEIENHGATGLFPNFYGKSIRQDD